MIEKNLHNTTCSPVKLKFATSSCQDPYPKQIRLLRLRGVLGMIPVARSTWLAWVASGFAPAPVKLGRTTAWRYSDLMTFIEQGMSQSRK